MKNPYEVLGISKEATDDDIKKAYRQLALKYHPDHNQGSKESEEKFKEINSAYETLVDPEKRKTYDTFGTIDPRATSNNGYIDPMEFIRRAGGFPDWFASEQYEQSNRSVRGDDIQKSITITFMDAALGATKNVSIDYPYECPTCKGTGAKDKESVEQCKMCNGQGKTGRRQGFMSILQTCAFCRGSGITIKAKCPECVDGSKIRNEKLKVSISAGLDPDNFIRLTGKGMPSSYGAGNGDLYLRVNITPHKKFKREELTIFAEEEINYIDAILGTKINIETIHGVIKLTIPPGTQPNSILKVKDKGIITNKDKGDHLVGIKVKLPKNITEEEKELLEKLKNIK